MNFERKSELLTRIIKKKILTKPEQIRVILTANIFSSSSLSFGKKWTKEMNFLMVI
jgi:hypothetical protein